MVVGRGDRGEDGDTLKRKSGRRKEAEEYLGEEEFVYLMDDSPPGDCTTKHKSEDRHRIVDSVRSGLL